MVFGGWEIVFKDENLWNKDEATWCLIEDESFRYGTFL